MPHTLQALPVADLDQTSAPVLEALEIVQRKTIAGFGGPGHDEGHGVSDDVADLLGRQVFHADVLTPKGLDDRRQSAQVMARATALAAAAWGADHCMFSTGGSTQALQTVFAAVARPGDTVLVAQNAHRTDFTAAVYAGLDIRAVPAEPDRARDLELGMSAATLESMLEAYPQAKAVVAVSPTIYGATSDIRALADLCHRRGVILVVDAAWGAPYPFSDALPRNPLDDGADVMVVSVHNTMAALAQGSALLLKGDRVDRERFNMVYEMFQTTSPSVPILASLDATRRDNALHGDMYWKRIVALAERVRAGLAAINGVEVRGREMIDGVGVFDIDATKVVFDVSGLGMTGSQADEWLQRERRVSVVVSDARHLVAVLGIGKTEEFVERLIQGVSDLASAARTDPSHFCRIPDDLPRYADLTLEFAMPAADAFYGEVEHVTYDDAVGRIAAEIVAPAPPEIPRLMPGQRIAAAHIAFLKGAAATGAVIPDPGQHGAGLVRVVR